MWWEQGLPKRGHRAPERNTAGRARGIGGWLADFKAWIWSYDCVPLFTLPRKCLQF